MDVPPDPPDPCPWLVPGGLYWNKAYRVSVYFKKPNRSIFGAWSLSSSREGVYILSPGEPFMYVGVESTSWNGRVLRVICRDKFGYVIPYSMLEPDTDGWEMKIPVKALEGV